MRTWAKSVKFWVGALTVVGAPLALPPAVAAATVAVVVFGEPFAGSGVGLLGLGGAGDQGQGSEGERGASHGVQATAELR